jgi:hypothetical protein
MPKGIPKPGTNWGIEISKRNLITGKVVYRPDGSIEKTKILMKDGRLDDSEPQPLYFPMDHSDKNLQGKFKGMAVILQERGFGDMSKVLASCKNFSANLEKCGVAVAGSSTISRTLLARNHCSK